MNSSSRNELKTEKFIWTITNFNRVIPRAGFSFKSSIIHTRHARKAWRFYLYPSTISNPNCMAAYFKKAYFMFDPALYNCSLSVGGSNGNHVKSFQYQSVDLQNFCIGGDECIRKDAIEKLPKGSVTVQCEITEVSQKSYFPSLVADFENLSSDLTDLYHSSMYYDLIVHLQQFEFYLHKCVLAARCRRLSHLFGYQSFNEMPEVVQIDDISPDLFRLLTYYLYSGKFEYDNVLFELFMCAHRYKLQSLKQLTYEKDQEYCTHTEIATQTLNITWDLKETRFLKENAVPFVQIFKLECCMTHLAVRMGIAEHHDGEKYIDVSFKVLLDTLSKPVSLLCVMTLFLHEKVHAYKKDSYNIEQDDEWHFPPFFKLSDIPESNEDYVHSSNISLTAEISLSDGCSAYNNLHTKTRLFTHHPRVVCAERLGNDLERLISSNRKSRVENHDIILTSVDNQCIPANKAVLWARWPAIRDLMNIYSDFSHLPLNLLCEEIHMLLHYIYTGSIPCLNYTSAGKLLQTNAKMECPPYIVEKCTFFLQGRIT